MTMLLVDGNNVIMRALYGTRNSGMVVDGVATGPLVGFINSLAKHVREELPKRLLLAWDGGPSVERLKISSAYKANRHPAPTEEEDAADKLSAFALAKQFVALARIPDLRIPGLEADDIIAGAWYEAADVDKIVILSSDKDFMQLLGPNPQGIPTEQIRLSSAGTDTDRWTADRVRADLRLEPHNLGLLAALTGDTSDGVAGIPGYGPVKAAKALEACGWDLQAVMHSLPDHSAGIWRDYQLVDLRHRQLPVHVPAWRPEQPGDQAFPELVEFLSTYRLRNIMEAVQANRLWRDKAVSTTPRSGWRA